MKLDTTLKLNIFKQEVSYTIFDYYYKGSLPKFIKLHGGKIMTYILTT